MIPECGKGYYMNDTLILRRENIIRPLGNMFGIFIEDLNHAVDGGLYGELICNRSFEYDPVDGEGFNGLSGWTKVKQGACDVVLQVESEQPLNQNNLHYLTMRLCGRGVGGVSNSGFHTGFPTEQGKRYRFSLYYRTEQEITLRVSLRKRQGDEELLNTERQSGNQATREKSGAFGSSMLPLHCLGDGAWHAAEGMLTAEETSSQTELVILADAPAEIHLDMVSLFPEDTFHRRKNGCRKDLAERLAALHPGFLRFPGGCLTHMGSLDRTARNSILGWKSTVGPIEERPIRTNNAWHYPMEMGMGFFEYFQLCEDLGCEPLPVLSAGYDPHSLAAASLEEMGPWVQDAVDLIEFASDDAGTRWGSVRASMGHPDPFRMKYLAIGNEEVGDDYFARYRMISDAVQKTHPEIQMICSGGPGLFGSMWQKCWDMGQRTGAALVDEHYYQPAGWFRENADMYLRYPYQASKPGVFVGEYASTGDTFEDALAEAAFMTGLERSRSAELACYAPLLADTDHLNWKPDLIMFRGSDTYVNASYYVQQLFMMHQGTAEIEVEDQGVREAKGSTDKDKQGRIISGISWDVMPPAGNFSFCTEGKPVMVRNLCFEDLESGNEKKWPETRTITRNEAWVIGDEETALRKSGHYRISFEANRSGSMEEDLAGQNPINLDFGVRDAQNHFRWTIGGWQRRCTLQWFDEGKLANLGDDYRETSPNNFAKYVLEVDGTDIRTWVEGKESLDLSVRLTQNTVFYTCASVNEKGDVILKAVNTGKMPQRRRIDMDRWTDRTGEIWQVAGHAEGDHGGYDHPDAFRPAHRRLQPGELDHFIFPPLSVTILQLPMQTEMRDLQNLAASK